MLSCCSRKRSEIFGIASISNSSLYKKLYCSCTAILSSTTPHYPAILEGTRTYTSHSSIRSKFDFMVAFLLSPICTNSIETQISGNRGTYSQSRDIFSLSALQLAQKSALIPPCQNAPPEFLSAFTPQKNKRFCDCGAFINLAL